MPKFKNVLLKVEQKHIDNGDPCSDQGCPVALAMLDADIHFFAVGWKAIDYGKSRQQLGMYSSRTMVTHTKVMNKSIRHFDNHQEMAPHTFRLKVPSWALPGA